MWLFKSNTISSPPASLLNVGFSDQTAAFWQLRPSSLLLLVVLSALLWYPNFIALQEEKQVLTNKIAKHKRQAKRTGDLLRQVSQLNWLDDYPWLAWQVTQESLPFKSDQMTQDTVLASISLTGKGEHAALETILNRLFDDYALAPRMESIRWLENGLVEFALVLQLVPYKMRVNQYQLLPSRGFQAWPSDMSLLAALTWQGQHHANLQVNGHALSVVKGDWVPELAARIIDLSDTHLVIEQQYLALTKQEGDKRRITLKHFTPFAPTQRRLEQTELKQFTSGGHIPLQNEMRLEGGRRHEG